MSEWIRKINWKYVVVMLLGNIILGLGIAIFKLSGLGNDPFSGMVMALAECVGIEYARFLILLNLGFFVIEIIWGRKLIGLGTIINALFLGYFVTFFYNLITSVIDAPDQMAMQVVTVFIGVIITSLGISMYQLPKQGVAPYDSISLIMTEKWPKIPYFWCRVSNDAISALVSCRGNRRTGNTGQCIWIRTFCSVFRYTFYIKSAGKAGKIIKNCPVYAHYT